MINVPKAGEYVYCIKSSTHFTMGNIYQVESSSDSMIWMNEDFCSKHTGMPQVYGFVINSVMKDYEIHFCSLRKKKLERLKKVSEN